MTIDQILEKLKKLQRVDIWMGSEEGYDDYWYSEESKHGDFVRSEDIDRLIKEIEKTNFQSGVDKSYFVSGTTRGGSIPSVQIGPSVVAAQ